MMIEPMVSILATELVAPYPACRSRFLANALPFCGEREMGNLRAVASTMKPFEPATAAPAARSLKNPTAADREEAITVCITVCTDGRVHGVWKELEPGRAALEATNATHVGSDMSSIGTAL